jgi:hypothetical protein
MAIHKHPKFDVHVQGFPYKKQIFTNYVSYTMIIWNF